MAAARRKLNPGEIVIGFVRPNGRLIGQFADPNIGHEAWSDQYPGLRSKLKAGQAIAVSIGKRTDGRIQVFASGHFPPPAGVPLSQDFKQLVAKLVE